MPKVHHKKITEVKEVEYPKGCKEINGELSRDELVKRLKLLARAFQDMGQDEPNKFNQLALFLATEYFMDHQNKDVRLLAACCIADVFRIFAPEAPYNDAEQIKEIFLFFTRQLRGLTDMESPSFKRYFYLLENLAWVKSFNICIELEDNQTVFCQLFKQMFMTIHDKHSQKVMNFMLDIMSPLINESDSVSQELLDIIFINLLEPHKTQNRPAYRLAHDLVKRTSNALEPYVQIFFNNTLMLGNAQKSSLSDRIFDLLYELNTISSSVLLAVLPQLEFKLKSNEEGERKQVTKLLSKMFSDTNSDLAVQNKPLWMTYLGRYNDIDVEVRRTCVQSARDFIINHPDLVPDLCEPLRSRTHDPDENVRMDVVQSIVGGAMKEYQGVTTELLECVKERTLDKKFKIRKEALNGLGMIYKKCMQKESTKREKESVGWIRNKILHAYYQSNIDDRFMVERLLNIALVPNNMTPDDRMERLYHLYGNLDDHAVKALQEVFKTQNGLRNILRSLLELHLKEPSDKVTQLMQVRLNQLSKNLPDTAKAHEYMKKFNKIIAEDKRVRVNLIQIVTPDCACTKAEECVKEVLKKMGKPGTATSQNFLYGTVRALLERVAPIMIDSTAIKAFLRYIDDAVNGIGQLCLEIPDPIDNGMKLLLMLAHVFPGSFQSADVYEQLIAFVKHDEDVVADVTLEIFALIGGKLEEKFPQIYTSLLPVLQKLVKIGTPRQAKHAIRCIDTLCKNKDKLFANIFEHLKKNMDVDSPYFLSSLVGIGHIAKICPTDFATPVKAIVSKFIVKELLMQDRGQGSTKSDTWCPDRLVSSETQTKVQAMKMMVNWLLGVKGSDMNSAKSTLRLLHTMISHDGDLMEKGKINKAEMARLRLQAGACMLKLAQEPAYIELLQLDQFQDLALLINDPVINVRTQFSQKLHKGLIQLRLPLQYMSILCLAANDPVKERRIQIKNNLMSNIQKRRDYLKTHQAANTKIFSILPDYALPYVIHLMAHDPELSGPEDVKTLKNIKECLWFIMEPLITKNDNYSYSFYKRMIENIKQTKDKQNPDSELDNYKLYAVCDLALSLVMSKTTNFVLKDFPAEPVLPARLFTQPDQSYSNTKNYLPKELINTKKKLPGMSTPISAAPLKSDKVTNGSPGSDAAPSDTNSPTSPTVSPRAARKAKRPISMQELSDDDEIENDPDSSTESAEQKQAPKRKGRPAKAASENKKPQGKITDFLGKSGGGSRRKSRETSPSVVSSSAASSPERSPLRSTQTEEKPKRKGRPPKRLVEEEEPISPSKKARGRVSESQDTGSPTPSSPARTADSSPSSKKRRTVSTDKTAPQIKNIPKRGNVRRAGLIANGGTSDGEEESIESPPSSAGDAKRKGTRRKR